jgi:prefoldin alpha subunit
MEKVDEREKAQKLLTQIGGYREMREMLRRQMVALSNAMSEISVTMESLKNLKVMKNAEVLVPIGCDSFVPAKITSVDKIVVGLGAEVAADRTPEEAENMLKARVEEIEKAMEQTRKDLESLEEKLQALEPEAERLIEKLNEEEQMDRGSTPDV